MVEQDLKVRIQYHDDRNLNARINLHDRFSTNPYGWHRWIFDQILAGTSNTARILEVGCGPAALWATNRDRMPKQWSIVLTDFSQGMADAASNNLTTVDHELALLTADAQALPFADDAFDAVIANHMLYHVPNRPRALADFDRVLAPKGRLYASTVGEAHMRDMWALVKPFVADVHERVTRASHSFTLENGGEQLAAVFSNVRHHIYEDNLVVTEIEPIIDYLRSSTTLMDCTLDTSVFEVLRRTIGAHIKTQGYFYIRKSSGLFVADKS